MEIVALYELEDWHCCRDIDVLALQSVQKSQVLLEYVFLLRLSYSGGLGDCEVRFQRFDQLCLIKLVQMTAKSHADAVVSDPSDRLFYIAFPASLKVGLKFLVF